MILKTRSLPDASSGLEMQESAEEHSANIDEMKRTDRARYVARAREQRAMVVARLRYGFEHRDCGQVVVGRTRDGFVELGLRSNALGLAGRLFVAGCRKAPHLRGGPSKSIMKDLGRDKVLGLDAGYVEGNRVMISLVRIDLDMIFPSTDHALRALQQVVDDGDLPCLPHLLVGDVGYARVRAADADGMERETVYREALIRPHAWIVLPPGSAVNAGPKGRPGPRHMLAGVARGICKALLHLGADPNASPFLVRGKNPLSPFLWSVALNNDHFPTLSDWSDWVDSRIPAETLSRMAAEKRSGADAASSNTAFTTLQKTAYTILRDLHVAGDAGYVAATQPSVDPTALEDLLRDRMPVSSFDRDPSWSETAAERILSTVIAYAAKGWDPAKADAPRKARGAMRHEVEGMTTKRAQAEAGRRSGGIKADKALRALVEAYAGLTREGKKPSKSAVADAAGVSRMTVSRRWDEVVKSVTIAAR